MYKYIYIIKISGVNKFIENNYNDIVYFFF